jgi:hypothetical protein
MVHRPAKVWNGTDWDDIGDSRLGSKLNIAGGKILQIVRATDSTDRQTTSTSAVDAGISVTITPQFNTSAIILIYSSRIQTNGTGGQAERRGAVFITDSSNNIQFPGSALYGTNQSIDGYNHLSLIGYSTPATTDATTYKVRFGVTGADTIVQMRNDVITASFFAIEVSA